MRDIELFLGELAGLGEEQGDEDFAVADSLVVFVLQAGFRHGIEKVFPANDLEIEARFRELVVPLAEIEFEFVPVVAELGGGCEKDANLYEGTMRLARSCAQAGSLSALMPSNSSSTSTSLKLRSHCTFEIVVLLAPEQSFLFEEIRIR